MPDDIIRPTPMYRQVAQRLADEIERGDHPPGSILPSETQLMERYGVSRPTVRAAVAELRTLGLVDSQHGKGTFVRQAAEPTATVRQTITRTGKQFRSYDVQFTEAEDRSISRTHTSGTEATLLQREEAPAFAVDRLLVDTDTGVKVTHRTVIPFDIAEEIPQLAAEPDTEPSAIYGLLALAGHTLHWSDEITSRAPKPDERATLRAPESAHLLVVHRVTTDGEGRPLLLEVFTTSAGQARLSYPVTPGRPPARK